MSYLSKKAIAIIGTIAGILGFGYLITRVKAAPSYAVQIFSNPMKSTILIDDKIELTTPQIVSLQAGKHIFKAVPKSPNLLLTYGFYKWTINSQTVSMEPTAEITITKPSIIIAHYQVVESGIYPAIEILET